MVITNAKSQQVEYVKNEHLFCLTISEFVDSVKEGYPELSDHLNIASIENSNRPTGGDEEHAQSSTSSSSSSHVCHDPCFGTACDHS